MAPTTRRSTGGKDGMPASADSTPATRRAGRLLPLVAASEALGRRSRSSKTNASMTESEPVSSVASPAPSVSEAGEYSTPGTSHFVTPAPSISANQTLSKNGRSRLVVELPDRIEDNEFKKPKGFGDLRSTRGSRASRPASYIVDNTDDDDLNSGNDSSPDAALARRLQREEDEKAADAITAKPSSSKLPLRRSTRTSQVAKDESDDDEYIQDIIRGLPSTLPDIKGKGKAPARSTATKRKPLPETSDDEDDDEDYDEDDDEPLSRSAPLRKRIKTVVSAHASDDEAMGASISTDTPIFISDVDGSSQFTDSDDSGSPEPAADNAMQEIARRRRGFGHTVRKKRVKKDRKKLEAFHPELLTMWKDLEDRSVINAGMAEQPASITRQMKPFQLEGLAWMKAMEQSEWKGGLLGDEMGLGKTIQAVSLIMSDYPAKAPSLILVPPVALMQWTAEMDSYTDKQLKTVVFHGTNSKAKNMTAKELKSHDVIMMSYNTLESLYRKQEKGFQRKDGLYKAKSAIHSIKFHRVILDEAHCIKVGPAWCAPRGK